MPTLFLSGVAWADGSGKSVPGRGIIHNTLGFFASLSYSNCYISLLGRPNCMKIGMHIFTPSKHMAVKY